METGQYRAVSRHTARPGPAESGGGGAMNTARFTALRPTRSARRPKVAVADLCHQDSYDIGQFDSSGTIYI